MPVFCVIFSPPFHRFFGPFCGPDSAAHLRALSKFTHILASFIQLRLQSFKMRTSMHDGMR
jgi:hypothetical protein